MKSPLSITQQNVHLGTLFVLFFPTLCNFQMYFQLKPILPPRLLSNKTSSFIDSLRGNKSIPTGCLFIPERQIT